MIAVAVVSMFVGYVCLQVLWGETIGWLVALLAALCGAVGAFAAAWRRLLGNLDRLRSVNWEEATGDGAFCPTTKRALASPTARMAKVQS